MKVKVKYPDQQIKESVIEKDTITIGRADFCDIQISDPHISRIHLRLSKYGDQYFFENLTESHRTTANNKECPKEVGQTYHPKIKIMLAGKYHISVDTRALIKEEINKNLSPHVKKLETKINSQNGDVKVRHWDRHFLTLLRYLIPLVTLIFMFFVFIDKKDPAKEKKVLKVKRIFKEKKVKKEDITWFDQRVKVSPNELNLGFIKNTIMRSFKCDAKMRAFCQYFFKVKRAPKEGIIKDKLNNLIFTLNTQLVRLRMEEHIPQKILLNLSDRDVLKLYIVKTLLNKKMVKRLNENAINEIMVLLFEYEKNQIEYLTDLKFTLRDKKEINRDELDIIWEEIRQGRKLDRFENQFSWIN